MRYAVLLLILLLLSGCQGIMGRSEMPLEKDIYVGKNGITMRFMPGMPGPKVWAENGLHLGIELRNVGTYDVQGGMISIGGYDPGLISDLVPQNGGFSFDIEGKSKLNPNGQLEILEYHADVVDIPIGSQFLKIPVQVVACYPYRTMIGIPVCVDVNSGTLARDAGDCVSRDWSGGAGQGAPVGVTKVDMDTFPIGENDQEITIQFTIIIHNLGNGQVISMGAYQQPCTEGVEIDESQLDWVDYIVGVEGTIITDQCQPINNGRHAVKLYEGKNIIVCTASFDRNAGNHQTLLSIALDYGYSNSITTNVEAVRMS